MDLNLLLLEVTAHAQYIYYDTGDKEIRSVRVYYTHVYIICHSATVHIYSIYVIIYIYR